MINLCGDIWDRWKDLHTELNAEGRWDLAALFKGHEPPEFRTSPVKIHYIGKATAGRLDSDDPGEEYFFCNEKAFWRFAAHLSGISSQGGDPTRCLAWSNICKIGVAHNNPQGELVQRQRHLAVETLRREWLELKPTVIVCAAENYLDDVIYDALGVAKGEGDGFREVRAESGSSFWVRDSIREWPAFFWMKHPQGKKAAYVDDAKRAARTLIIQAITEHSPAALSGNEGYR